jgi:hypothetical protein
VASHRGLQKHLETVEADRCPSTDEWISKMWSSEIVSLKKGGNSDTCNMDEPSGRCAE